MRGCDTAFRAGMEKLWRLIYMVHPIQPATLDQYILWHCIITAKQVLLTLSTLNPEKRSWSGKPGWTRRLFREELRRTRTRCSSLKHLSRTHSLCHCSVVRSSSPGTRRCLPERWHAQCQLVSSSSVLTFASWLGLKATSDGRSLIAVGCAEGIWMGFRQNPECKFLFTCLEGFFYPTFSLSPCCGFEDGDTVCCAGRVWDLPCSGWRGKFYDLIAKSYSQLVIVSLCIPYWSPRAELTEYFAPFASASEIEWIQGRPLLPCRNSTQSDCGRLHEEKWGTVNFESTRSIL